MCTSWQRHEIDATRHRDAKLECPHQSRENFELPVYANQMASSFADFGCSKSKRRKDGYAVAVLQFIDGSALEGRESSESSGDSDSMT